MNSQKPLSSAKEGNWWRGAVIYQIYPRSFADSNGDGIGDLRGITIKLDYVASLGVDGIWISPFFTSPMRDFGYDVSNYREVDSRFGTLADFDALIAKAKSLGLRVVIDQVWSHTSNQHSWFQASRLDRNNPFADWYVWSDARPDGAVPNNWQAWFGGPAWSWDPMRGQYFFHNFMPEMPDLNFHNQEVQNEIIDTARFWLNRGVDGFRLDTANFYFHDAKLCDNPPKEGRLGKSPVEMQSHVHNVCQPQNLQFLEKVRSTLDDYGAMSVAEISSEDDIGRMIEYTTGDNRLHTAYSFLLLRGRLDAKAIDALMSPWISEGMSAWPSWAFSNHDTPRVTTRWQVEGAPWTSDELAKQLLTLLLCLRGNAFIYQGEELGLTQSVVPYELVQDPAGVRGWPQHKGRDGCRTPMPWDSSKKGAGFTTGKPWLPIDAMHSELAVAIQSQDKSSTLSFTKHLLQVRSKWTSLRNGDYQKLFVDEDLLVFRRNTSAESAYAAFNLGTSDRSIQFPFWGETELTSLRDARYANGCLHLPGGSALVSGKTLDSNA